MFACYSKCFIIKGLLILFDNDKKNQGKLMVRNTQTDYLDSMKDKSKIIKKIKNQLDDLVNSSTIEAVKALQVQIEASIALLNTK
jgi:hypothetical protein